MTGRSKCKSNKRGIIVLSLFMKLIDYTNIIFKLLKCLIMETEFKVGDKVKGVLGIGIIESISMNNTYPIRVRFEDGSIVTYTLGGIQFRNSSDYSNITKVIWEVGQRVFTASYGWGVIQEINSDDFPIVVKFDNDDEYWESYTCDGRECSADKYPILSFTNYIADRFSQDPKDATYEQIAPDFDWGCLSAWCNDWIAKNKDGIWYSYKSKPEIYSKKYVPENYYTRIHHDYYPKNSDKIDWNNSIYKNPNK